MDRMLSAYLDKMVFLPEKVLLPYYRRCIKERGRKIIASKNSREKISLPDCNMQDALTNAGKSFGANNNSSQASEIPTFEEFLEFVLSTDLHGYSIN